MDKFQENEFYKDNGWPTEYLEYCQYRFLQDPVTECGHDYDQFAIVANAVYPYIRLTQKIGRIHTPCGGSLQIACDGSFATKSDAERDRQCPKVAWGIAAVFLSHLRYDNGQRDYVLMKQKEEICKSYYESYLIDYLDNHNSLRYEKISVEQKELAS